MTSALTLDTLLLSLCAGSFVTTCFLLVLSILSRASFRLKVRVLRLFFSVGLTAVIVGLLARSGESAASHALVIATANAPHSTASASPSMSR